MVLLSGRLEVVVIEARGLPDLDVGFWNKSDKSDPYCIVSAEGINGSKRIGKTFTIDDCLNPKWNFKMESDLHQDVSGLKFTVKDKDVMSSETIGSCFLDIISFTSAGKQYRGLMHLTSPKGKPAGSLRVQILFTGTGTGTTGESTISEKIKVASDDIKHRFSQSSSKSIDHGILPSTFLHGILELFIDKATNLPNLDTSVLSFKKKDVSDPYVVVTVEDARKEKWKVATSSVVDNNLNPIWRERFHINVCHDVVAIKFVIKDKDVISSDEIGSFAISAMDLKPLQEISGDFDVHIKGKNKKKSQLTLRIKFIPTKDILLMPEVNDCLFPLRELNKVTLYQDAHCVNLQANVPGRLGFVEQHRRAWLDLYHTITNAKQFIYIVGWSVNAKVSLLRWNDEDTRCIGDILVQKAQEGVQVCIMVWDELTSTELNKGGAMNTSDEATAEFFKNTKVTVILASRERRSKDIISTKEHFTNFCYTHHQKCILADAATEGMPGSRHAVAFVGGLDLTNGRFDTPEHPLFRTLDSDHKKDFYNSVIDTTVQFGPREPWHDIHCRMEGPAAMDLLTNFMERWKRQGSKKRKSKNLVEHEDPLQYNFRMPGRWNVQVFRSINSDSAYFPYAHLVPGLNVKKERLFDNSIQRAYIHQIRRSKKFLYVENQYFMGSSNEWLECRDAQIKNLVPLEIATHIEEKIKARERYTAYILIPMFPEGKPADKVIQEMLHWQYRTMEMMYYRIAEAITAADIEAHPQDYLLFFCLGKKEGRNPVSVPSELTGHAANAFKHRRLMIYVHSKMAIFDDEYVIVGSANINDRSLNGNRDTEIAIGAFQPEYMVRGSMLPDGDVAFFRKSLWAEHMGNDAPLAEDPSSLSCTRRVKELAEEGLLSFIDLGENPGIRHLLLYPLDVHQNGGVAPRYECQTFPDTTAKITGARSGYIPTPMTS